MAEGDDRSAAEKEQLNLCKDNVDTVVLARLHADRLRAFLDEIGVR